MQYIVSANLKNGVPQLSVINAVTSRVCIRWKLEKIKEMFETGEIKQDEFLQPEKYGMNLLIKNLFLISCSQELNLADFDAHGHKQNTSWFSNIKLGPMK